MTTGRSIEFNLLPEDGHRYPAFINLQQPYFERFLVERVREAQAQGAPIESARQEPGGCCRCEGRSRGDLDITTRRMALTSIEADWLIGCDGASSLRCAR